jgi:hypothetical protein
MEKLKLDLSKYKKVESKIKTKWQDEVSKWLKEFGIAKSMHVVVWKHIGKGGRNFGFAESKVAGIRELAEKYKKTSKDYAGNFINMLKQLK